MDDALCQATADDNHSELRSKAAGFLNRTCSYRQLLMHAPVSVLHMDMWAAPVSVDCSSWSGCEGHSLLPTSIACEAQCTALGIEVSHSSLRHAHQTDVDTLQMWTGKGSVSSWDASLDRGVGMKRVLFNLFTMLSFLVPYFKLNKLFTVTSVVVFYFLM